MRKADLRLLAAEAYRLEGATVVSKKGRGLVPNARLVVTKSGRAIVVAVRSSLDRELAVTRHLDGRIAIVPEVDEVAVVCPSLEAEGRFEVLFFDKTIVLAAAERAIAYQQQHHPNVAPKAPVFLPLEAASDSSLPGLATQASRRITMSPSDSDAGGNAQYDDTIREFRDRVLREFADLLRLSLDEVAVELHILTPRRG
jgi:hypothetical protein